MNTKVKCLLLISFLYTTASAQMRAMPLNSGGNLSSPPVSQLSDRMITGRPLLLSDLTNIEGSPFLTDEYQRGFIRIRNGQTFTNIPVRFNMLNNEIQFRQNNIELALEDVDSVIYLTVDGDSSSARRLKAGYPAVDGHTAKSIYEVLADNGSVQLLKYYSCKTETVKRMGEADKKAFVTETSLYVLVNGEMKKVKNNKKSVLAAFPQYAKEIDQIDKELNINFKTEKGLEDLVLELNRRIQPTKAF